MEKYYKSYNIILDDMSLLNYRLRPISAISYIQDAFARYTASKSMSAYDMLLKNLYWIVSEFNIDFDDVLPFWSEEIKIEIWFSELSKLKIYTDFKLYYNNKCIAKGNALWFLIDINTKRPFKTTELANKISICNDFAIGAHKKFSYPNVTEKINEITHINNLSDIDFNKHVNNKSYINIAEMTLSQDFQTTHTIKSLRIKYNKETFLDDTLNCTAYKTEEENTFLHKIEKGNISVCEIKSVWTNGTNTDKIVDFDTAIKSENS